ncbi:MAG: hypothetical protein RL238_367 [Actinomycetota bacterium]|jgi:Ca2+-binding RTX toxin-like protein
MYRFRRESYQDQEGRRLQRGGRRWALALTAAMAVPVVAPLGVGTSAAPVGQGFELNASDLRYILQQIKIAEHHVAFTDETTGQCGALIGDGPDQIPTGGVGVTLPWGLRTVDGSCNNLVAAQSQYGTADETFPRMAPAEPRANYPFLNGGAPTFDRSPRVISNLIVDQSINNPAAATAAGEGAVPDEDGTFFIPNVAPDTGLSAPYNSWFTLFGQFFDHGLDLVTKDGAFGTVIMQLNNDDPLFNQGPNVMFLTRAAKDANGESTNQTSSWVDQSQTYSSHPSHQVFLREYVLEGGVPVATGHLITGPGDGMADWGTVKAQAREVLGIELTDADVTDIPLLVTDPYGNFIPGDNGFPQLVMSADGSVLAEGALPADEFSLATPTTGAQRIGHAFLDDIAHHAAPNGVPDGDAIILMNENGVPIDDGDPGTYDDELLDSHFIAGDGRVNENIGLTAVHHIFHSEHNRLVEDIKGMIETSGEFSDAEIADWQAFRTDSGFDYNERLFQAARFVTEMQYQHLAFEEFVRKVQPMVNLFGEGGTGYQTDLDPRITAEFAHAVYRFGHSMLTETVDRVTPDGVDDSMPLLDAFLNPPAFFDTELDAGEAAGNIIRGMTRQVGNELDEFVTEALRNDLVGLPLDLAALNLARGRDTGIPTLNSFRRTIYAQTADAGLVPYTSWIDFGMAMRNEASLVNFVAAYGTHASITGATTVATKRAAAEALFDLATSPVAAPTVDSTPEEVAAYDAYVDARDFLISDGAYANVDNGMTVTGVDAIDLWMGGLAERQNVFGGLLGPTFNYVFEIQMENLQDGDRFYYLSRTAGMNLLTQLEGNSFAELIMRNTDVEGLPADSFSWPAYVFDLSKQNATGPIVDDDLTEWDERQLLVREVNGTIRYAGPEHVVFNGSPNGDKARSSEGDDTMRGNDGNDVMEGGDGNDHLIGGDGNDIITDLFGDEMIKGGPGNDVISSGRGFAGDLVFGGGGNDFVAVGNDLTETFGGPGDDFVLGGDDMDTVFGDEGSDWIEGGRGPFNLLQGDNGAPFQNDINAPGDDVLFGWGGEVDYDSEGGDDIMFAGPGIQRAEGMQGFDWVTHRGDPEPVDSDMDFTVLLQPAVETNRDRFDLVEALSGWNGNDVIRGNDADAGAMVGHELTTRGFNLIAGLDTLLVGDATEFTGGNILLGGAGNDLIEGRGGDDLIDGDRWLNAQLRVPNLATADPSDTKLVDNLPAIRADLLAGRLNPGQIVIERRIEQPSTAPSTDTAVFSDVLENYTIEPGTDPGTYVVSHLAGAGVDGTDTLRGIERLMFAGGIEVQIAVMFNTMATGDVVVDNLTPTEGDILTATATVADAEGVTAPVSIVWEMETSPFNWELAGFGDTLLLTDDHVGFPVRALAIFEDGVGVVEQVTGQVATAPVLNVNDAPTGGPALSTDAPEVGTALSVDITSIADEDGLPAPLPVQWFADGLPIAGADEISFIPTLAQAGKVLQVKVEFTDLHGTPEQLVSGFTDPVATPALPELSVDTTSLAFGTRAIGSAPTQQMVTITNTGTAPLLVNGATVSGAAAASYIALDGCAVPLAPTESCVVTVSFLTSGTTGAKNATLTITTNDTNGPAVVALSGTLVANTAPTGAAAIDDATPIETQLLTASSGSIADLDGLSTATFQFRWQQNALGGGGAFVDIVGATDPTLLLGPDQANRRIRVVATFTDDRGTVQSVASAATAVAGDVFPGTPGFDVWTGTVSDDLAMGGALNDALNGAGGNDIIAGEQGDDTLQGGAGNDLFQVNGTGHGFDNVNGGVGGDVIQARSNGTIIGLRSIAGIEQITSNGFANVTIWGTTGAEVLNFGGVALVGIVSINGGGGNDNLSGSAAGDVLNGGSGDDILVGNGGVDIITGAGGNDTITPGAGNDTVIFGIGDNANTVIGFDSNPTGGQDRLDVRALGVTAANFNATVIRQQVGANTRITIGAVRITLTNVNVGTITVADFIV